MMEEKKEKWLGYLALTTVILAVCATLATFKGAGYSTRSILLQNKATNQWSYFQSKSIKGYLYEIQKEQMELRLAEGRDTLSETSIKNLEKKIGDYSANIKRYADEKSVIMKEAQGNETERDSAQKHNSAFGIAVIFLQIAILLSSIAALMKMKIVYYTALAVGAWGMVSFVNGFLLFM